MPNDLPSKILIDKEVLIIIAFKSMNRELGKSLLFKEQLRPGLIFRTWNELETIDKILKTNVSELS